MKEGELMTFRSIRQAAGLTQQQLADRSHIRRITISRIENHVAKPGSDTLRALSTALGCSVDEILKGIEEKPDAALPDA
jgi:transcriptional regulator with XRE-family HTH domain